MRRWIFAEVLSFEVEIDAVYISILFECLKSYFERVVEFDAVKADESRKIDFVSPPSTQ